ncbi:hypothetical protein Q8G47_28490, partial [Klebsiella pneumoniae]|uniref:hypothetical protein n=1 Tax=Klebsiella pneumoniae TaxID=573 RepID=UPI0030135261
GATSVGASEGASSASSTATALCTDCGFGSSELPHHASVIARTATQPPYRIKIPLALRLMGRLEIRGMSDKNALIQPDRGQKAISLHLISKG